MYRGKKILGLIPARGGSKGLPKKNIRNLNGKPLIAWTISQALKSVHLDKVVVSTDCRRIASVSKYYGAEVPVMRPSRLASDSSNVVDAVLLTIKVLEKRGQKFDYLALLEPTSPLRQKDDIDNSIKKLIKARRHAESLVSVGKITLEHPAYSKKINSSGYLKSFCDLKNSFTRQGLEKAYFPYGVIYLSKVDTIKKRKKMYAGRALPFFIKRWQNYEINDIYDFMAIEKILQYHKEINEK